MELQLYFEELLQVEIDKSGKDITRLCFFSYDPELYLNENAETFYPNTEKGSKENEQKTKSENIKSAISVDNDTIYEHSVRFTEKKIQFTEGNRNNFVFALANNLNRKGISESMALGYILADYGYDAKEVTTAVQSAYQNTAEHNTDTFQPKKTRVINESKKNRSLSEVEVPPSKVLG